MLTKKKRLYAEGREAGKNQKDSALYAGCPENSAKGSGSRYEKDPDVIKYREKLRSGHFNAKGETPEQPNTPDRPAPSDIPTIPADTTNEDAAIVILRMQLHSEDERIAQGAAKALLDYEVKKKGPIGKKGEQQKKAEGAEKGAFSSMEPPKLAAKNGERIK